MKALLKAVVRVARSRRGERGQMLIVFALVVLPVTAALGAVAIDTSMWQSERRGAQKDADLASLAGAYELLNQDAGPDAVRDAAQAAANRNQDANDEAGNAEIIDKDNVEDVIVDNSCFGTEGLLDSVKVNVRHKSNTFFSGLFGMKLAPDIGAHARACMGSPIEGEGLIPLGVQVTGPNTNCFDLNPDDPAHDEVGEPEVPIFGQYCQLAFAGENLGSGEGGFLRLFDDGSSQCSTTNIQGEDTGGPGTLVGEEIEDGGANTTCYVAPPGASCDQVPDDWPYGDVVNYCVWPKTMTFNNPTQNSFYCLIRGSDEVGGNDCTDSPGEGECDALFGNGDGIDDWLEVVEPVDGDPSPSADNSFARRACTSPRLVNLIIIKQFCDGNDPSDPCTGNKPRPILAFASFYIQSCKVSSNKGEFDFPDCNIQGVGQIGQAGLYGFFMNVLNIGTIGAYNGYGQRTIALWE